MVWLPRAYALTFGKTLDTIKQSAIRVTRRTSDNVTFQEIFDECTTAHNDLHRNRGFSPWQLLLGKTLVLIQERETTAEGVRMKGVVWIIRCAVQHLRSLSESEKRLCSIADTEAISFQDLVRRLPHSTFLDLTTQADAPDDAWEEEITFWDPRST